MNRLLLPLAAGCRTTIQQAFCLLLFTLAFAVPSVAIAAPPTANPVTATVAANSSNNEITANLSGDPATSVAITSAASHGTATAVGTRITYTPTAGYSGSDSFTYTATNADGTSSPATVSITVTAPTLNLTPSTLSRGTVGTAYSATFSASAGAAPYSYSITTGSLPGGLSLDPATGEISGTPTGDGTSNFTVTVTDTYNATGSRAYSLVIGVQPVTAGDVTATVTANSNNNPITLNLGGGTATHVHIATSASHGTATASGTSITYTPTAGYSGSDSFTYGATNAAGTSRPATVNITVSAPTLSLTPSTLSDGNVGTAYSAIFSASAGTAPYSYAITAGSLPAGLSLNAATGELSGIPTGDGTSHFSVTATDANNATGSSDYALVIGVQPPTAVDVNATVNANSSNNEITLNLGNATTSVAVARAPSHGTAVARGTNITYTPTAGYSGADSFTYTVTSAGGTSSPATVTITVRAVPDPSKDAEVIGLINAQSRAAERFASTQMANFNRRLERLHQNTCNASSFGINLSVRGTTIPVFELAVLAVDGLLDKTQDSAIAEGNKQPATLAPVSDEDRRLTTAPPGTADACGNEPLAFWTDGFVNFGSNDSRQDQGTDFTTIGLSGGIDYRVTSDFTIGLGLGYGSDRSQIGSRDTRSDADAVSAAFYASFHPMPQVFIDGVLGYSRISFDSRRFVTADPTGSHARGSRDANQVFGSITGSYEHRQGNLLLAAYGRLNAASTRFDAFSESGGSLHALHYGTQSQRYVTSFLGLRSTYDLPTGRGMVTPTLRVEWGHNFSSNGGVDIRYANLPGGSVYRLDTDPLSSDFVNIDLGADIHLGKLWLLGIGYKTSLGVSGEQDQLVRIDLTSRF
ncbi:autotransporter domain-containing protein [Crenobacter caeni]|uniref:Autotransporter domain-containing protein n=1 Tax=Crenobacter caeni TaxID=2705474 RepID=A0A6B2KVC5_9NEIS|nr:autotransporter domain-containing protein [Crenobacter caeni]NDV14111.1 autotransporter domain-containing protein [Crenobacter caeni]